MPIPGQEVMRRISESVARVAGIEQAARDAAAATAGEVDRMVADQSEAFRELAQLYLPGLDDNVERDGWSEVRATLQSIILRKEDSRRLASSRLHLAAEQRETVEALWKALSERANELSSRCDELAQQLKDRMANDTEFQSLSKKAAEGQARLEQAENSLETVEKDAIEKLPQYNRSRFFRYLYNRDFGTPAYARRGLTRRLDRWVSQLIDYPRAVAGYKFLATAPQQMKQLISDQHAAVQAAVTEAESRQAAAAVAVGIAQVQWEGTRVRSEQSAAEVASARARQEEAAAQKELANLDSSDCPFYREAVTAFQQLLQRTERSLLAARAAQTPELTDDQVVARLRHIDDVVNERKRLMDGNTKAIEVAAKHTADMNELASRCRRAQFDHPRRIFDDRFDLEGRLSALAAGTADIDSVWHQLHRSQQIESPVADNASAMLQSPMAQILLSTMAQVAGAALGAYASRAGQQHRLPKGNGRDWF